MSTLKGNSCQIRTSSVLKAIASFQVVGGAQSVLFALRRSIVSATSFQMLWPS